MSASRLAHFALLPELELCQIVRTGRKSMVLEVRKRSEFEVCPKCAAKCSTVDDHRKVKISDAPIRDSKVTLRILKRSFLCKKCSGVFMEPVSVKSGNFKSTYPSPRISPLKSTSDRSAGIGINGNLCLNSRQKFTYGINFGPGMAHRDSSQ